MKNLILSILLSLFTFGTFAQVKGTVYGSTENKKEPLFGVKVFFKDSEIGTITDEKGAFTLDYLPTLPDTLIFRAQGYYPDTLVITKKDRFLSVNVTLYSSSYLPEVVISYQRENSTIERLNPLFTETLSSGELRKAACCNLSESFETNASVDVNLTDAVSGAKKIQMMGLAGTYTQIQFENIPMLKNLGSAYGLNMIPGTWINSIQITKGSGTVVNGYESMAGLINLEFYQPGVNMDKFYFNAYTNIQGRNEVNFHNSIKLSDKWSTGIFGHASLGSVELDRNKDGFKDIPLSENFTVMNRWNYEGENFESKFGVRASVTSKTGGQIGFKRNNNPNNLYGVSIDNQHAEAFAKTGFYFKKSVNSSLGIVYQAKYHGLQAQFGTRSVDAEERRGYVNAIFNTILGNTSNTLKTGLSFVYDDLRQTHYNLGMQDDQTTLNRTEVVPGAFAEYTKKTIRHDLVLGARGDYHNLFGFQFSPRAHYKFKVTEKVDLRLTAGRGFRVPNYVVDNLSLMANNKPWILNESLKPEVSWNFGGSLVYELRLFKRAARWSVDAYHTLFTNQVIVDRDQDAQTIYFRNLEGQSYSNAIQTDFSFKPLKNLEVKMAYKYLDVKATFGGSLQEKIMVPTHRGFINFGYITRNKRWEYDLTASVFGTKRLPRLALNDAGTVFTADERSKAYGMVNAQITHVYKRWDFYLGGENLLNYTQKNPIIDAQNPFSSTFDATRIWAPVIGINVYAGVRFSIEHKK
ncbi:Outer membrane receptor for ferrienterochelin and colicins [Lishizhenia tianjinensis]|uniref:Outer membrane receptor for ferrienterochelin and colicins n=1 Tax=Lishizhenia tianjinensis TaxID=477690 RepID=A0A1I7A162_9FLAO|nr:TonB-dependent receptor [Lishizhenia tianjinensis]SFT68670.1 Outer membrane receptor for ferrienterochelin and colicins [Lishizhenia tianjinensis]